MLKRFFAVFPLIFLAFAVSADAAVKYTFVQKLPPKHEGDHPTFTWTLTDSWVITDGAILSFSGIAPVLNSDATADGYTTNSTVQDPYPHPTLHYFGPIWIPQVGGIEWRRDSGLGFHRQRDWTLPGPPPPNWYDSYRATSSQSCSVSDSGTGCVFQNPTVYDFGGPPLSGWEPDILQVSYSPESTIQMYLPAGGAAASQAATGTGAMQVGYAKLTLTSGDSTPTPYGTAVLSLINQDNVVISEAGIPPSPPTVSARIFIDYRTSVDSMPGRSDSGKIDVNTGIAVVNYGSSIANVTYTLRDLNGVVIATGHGTIASGKHFGKFISEFRDVAPDFNMPSNFPTTTQFGSLDIASDQPLSVLGMRGTTNQRGEFLFTTTPVADLTQSLGSRPIYFPEFLDGGGYATSLLLLNASGQQEAGTLQILNEKGAPLVVNQAGGAAGSSFRYSIAPNGALRFQTDGAPAGVNVGWVRLTPDTGSQAPVASGVFGYNPGSILVSESGIPAAALTTHARVHVDLSGNHNTGLAIASPGGAGNITIKAYYADGRTPVGTSGDPLQLATDGHAAKFATDFVSGLPAGFSGVLDISSTTPFAALAMRTLTNERNDFLFATFPIADANQAAPSPVVFPEIASDGGYMTQIILLGTGSESEGTLSYFDDNGSPLPVGTFFK